MNTINTAKLDHTLDTQLDHNTDGAHEKEKDNEAKNKAHDGSIYNKYMYIAITRNITMLKRKV